MADVKVTKTIGRYRIVRMLGQGGMGIVYEAHDERLNRPVALKLLHGGLSDGQDRERLWREARASASVNHPNVCQLYEIGEVDDELFLAMELLEGEPLNDRIARGPLPLVEAVQIAQAVLGALTALHERGIVHRDLKPSNIFLSRYGVKLLDFGLARSFAGQASRSQTALTMPGVLVGTPRYMAPEQLTGGRVDARSDLFALGAVLYEMLAGHPPFAGDSMFELGEAILRDEPRPLGGSSGVVAVDRVIHRALRKEPGDRFPTAEAFALDLRATLLVGDASEPRRARPMMRLVVLPFRLLRPDPAIDFLAFSLADAIASTLSGLPSLVVRSTVAASRVAGEAPDLKALARELDVDVALIGTLLHGTDRVRVNAQLVQVPTGTLVRAITSQATLGDIFQLQDDLARSIVDSLSLSLTASDESRINRDAPASAEAYEFYLRANQICYDSEQWATARDLYLRCLDLDRQFAPAWARLGRCYRLLGKYAEGPEAQLSLARAEEALHRALDLNPDLSLAHNLYVQVDVEAGRAREAMVRLLARVRHHASEPDLYAGLVHVCRYCGLLDASEAAYELARRLDPAVITSVAHTFLAKGDYERACATDLSDPAYIKAMALAQTGRTSEAIELLRAGAARGLQPHLHSFMSGLVAMLEGRHSDTIAAFRRIATSSFRDPEGFYGCAMALAQAGDIEGGLELLERSVDGGFHPVVALVGNPWLEPIRSAPDFRHIVKRAESLQRVALEAFRAADGPRLLGIAAL